MLLIFCFFFCYHGLDILTSELGQLDSSDEKLQKMLESGLNTDGFNNADMSTATDLLSPQVKIYCLLDVQCDRAST